MAATGLDLSMQIRQMIKNDQKMFNGQGELLDLRNSHSLDQMQFKVEVTSKPRILPKQKTPQPLLLNQASVNHYEQ